MKGDFLEIFSFTCLYPLPIQGTKSLMEGFVLFFPFAPSKIKKENHLKGLRTVNCVYLHVFFLQSAASQQNQVQEHKTLYHSINSYSEEIAETVKDLSPLGVLKTAILLEALSTPAIQAKMNTLSPAPYQGKWKYERSCSTDIRLRYK